MSNSGHVPPVSVVKYLPYEYVNENCPHCKAEWGHFLHCPLINRESAEAHSRLFKPTEADKIAAHALGIEL